MQYTLSSPILLFGGCWTDVLAFVDHLLQFFLQACKNSNLPSTVDGWNPVSLYQVGCIKPLKWLDTLPMTWYGIALPSPVWLNGKNSIPEDRRGGELIFSSAGFLPQKAAQRMPTKPVLLNLHQVKNKCYKSTLRIKTLAWQLMSILFLRNRLATKRSRCFCETH